MPRFAVSDLVLHCLPMSDKKDAWFIWVKFDPDFIVVVFCCNCVIFSLVVISLMKRLLG